MDILGWIKKIGEFISKIWDVIGSFFKWLQDAFNWVVDFILGFPDYLFSLLVDGVVGFFNWLPVPSFFSAAASAFSSVPDEVVFFAQAFRIGEGVTLVLGAYLLRFILRRIPIIG